MAPCRSPSWWTASWPPRATPRRTTPCWAQTTSSTSAGVRTRPTCPAPPSATTSWAASKTWVRPRAEAFYTADSRGCLLRGWRRPASARQPHLARLHWFRGSPVCFWRRNGSRRVRRCECMITSTWFSRGEGDRCNTCKLDSGIFVSAGSTSFCWPRASIFLGRFHWGVRPVAAIVRSLGYTCFTDMRLHGSSIDVDIKSERKGD